MKAPKMRATVDQRVLTPQEVADDAKVEAVAAGAAAAAAAEAQAAEPAPAGSPLEAAVAKAAAASAASPLPPPSSHRASPTFSSFLREQDFNGSTFRTTPGGTFGEPGEGGERTTFFFLVFHPSLSLESVSHLAHLALPIGKFTQCLRRPSRPSRPRSSRRSTCRRCPRSSPTTLTSH